MAHQEKRTVNGYEVILQSVSPEWYMDNLDRYGRGKNTKKYVDELIKNVVVSPADIAAGGLAFFSKQEDLATPMMLAEEIESFLSRPRQPGNSKATGAPTA